MLQILYVYTNGVRLNYSWIAGAWLIELSVKTMIINNWGASTGSKIDEQSIYQSRWVNQSTNQWIFYQELKASLLRYGYIQGATNTFFFPFLYSEKETYNGWISYEISRKLAIHLAHQCINMSALAAAQNGGSEGFTLKNYITNLAYPQAKNAVELSAK